MTKNQSFLLFWLLIAFSIILKIPVLGLPFTGHFASYQSLNAMMASMIGEAPAEIPGWIFPQTFLLQEGRAGLHLLYYPFASLSAWLGNSVTGWGLDFWGRFQALLYMSLAAYFLWNTLRRTRGERIAVLSATVFLFSPMGLIYGTSFQNEAFAVCTLTLSYFLLEISKRSALGGLLFGLCVVSRLHFLLVFPAFVYLLAGQPSPKKRWMSLGSFSLAFLIPLCLWLALVVYGQNHWGHVESSLLDQTGEGRLFHTMLGTLTYTLRLAKILLFDFLNPLFFLFLILFFFKKRKTSTVTFFILWLAGSVLAALIVPKKVADHPFYLISALPAASVLTGLVLEDLLQSKRGLLKFFIFSFFALNLSLAIVAPILYPSPTESLAIPRLGKKVQTLSSSHDRIIASHGSACDLLYYSHRKGWTFDLMMEERKIEQQKRLLSLQAKGYGKLIAWLEYLRSQGAKYLVLSDAAEFYLRRDFSSYVESRYRNIDQSGNALIFDLTTYE
ncbi:MAG: glycosyltransferase family 39 protein [Candidatus Omnitrophica bacterium]|nr:glycosyltransferase family 39 protein [Candidatus Omnitrophota bacterium]